MASDKVRHASHKEMTVKERMAGAAQNDLAVLAERMTIAKRPPHWAEAVELHTS